MRRPHRWFLPETPDVLGMLGDQIAITVEGMQALVAWADGDVAAVERLRECEHRADDCKRDLRAALTSAFTTPLEPEDLFELSRDLDRVLNNAKNAVREAEVMETAPDAAIAEMAAELAEGTRHLADAFTALGRNGSTLATEAATREAKSQSRFEHVYRQAMSALIANDDLREVAARRELYRRLARSSDDLREVAERVWYSVLKKADRDQGRRRSDAGTASADHSGGAASQRESAERKRQPRAARDDSSVERHGGVEAVSRRGSLEGVIGVGQRQRVGDELERARHLLARHEQPAEQELGKDDGGHELDRLELRAGEGAQEQPQRAAQDRVRDGENEHPGRAGDGEVEQRQRDERDEDGLQRRGEREGGPVPEQDVQLGQRQGHQPLERPAGALSQHRDRRNQEHCDERKQAEERPADPVEDERPIDEQVLEERDESTGHDE